MAPIVALTVRLRLGTSGSSVNEPRGRTPLTVQSCTMASVSVRIRVRVGIRITVRVTDCVRGDERQLAGRLRPQRR